MAMLVWKKLRPRDLEAFLRHIEAMPQGDRLLYGLRGKKKIKFLHWILAVGTKHYALYFTNDRIVLSQRNETGSKEKRRIDHAVGDLVRVHVTKGPVWETILLEFRDGFKIKLKGVTRGMCGPVERMADEGTSAFARARLSDEQITSCYFAYAFARLIPKDVLK